MSDEPRWIEVATGTGRWFNPRENDPRDNFILIDGTFYEVVDQDGDKLAIVESMP